MWKSCALIRGVLLVWCAAVAQGGTLEELEGRINRHSQALRQMSTYFVKTDQFWRWYTRSHRQLNAMLDGRGTAVPGTEGQLDEIAQRLRLIETELHDDYMERQAAQQQRLQRLEEQVVRLTANLTATNLGNEALQKEVELGSQDLGKVLMFVRQMTVVSNNTMQELKEQVRRLSERVATMGENVTTREHVATEKEKQMLTEISQLKERFAALEENQKVTTEVNALLNGSVVSINEEIRNITEKSKRFPAIESRLNLLRDKMENFESAPNERTLRAIQEISESKMLTMENQLNSTKEQLNILTEQTNQLRSHQESANDTRSEITHIKDRLQNLRTQSQNTATRFDGVQRSVESIGGEVSGLRSSVANIDGRLNNVRSQIDGMRNSVSATNSDITALKNQVESMRMTPAGLAELREKVAEIAEKVEAKSIVRKRGDELLNSITSSSSANAARPLDLVSDALANIGIQNLPD